MKPPTNKTERERTPITLRLALSFFLCSFAGATLLQCTGVFERNEAQNINRLFEIRRWIKWSPTSLSKLNPQTIWAYHQEHEFPRHIWNWDYTLSWLIADNHPPITQKIVIFNHLNEDDVPAAAIDKHPWLKPLLSRDLSRAIYADWLKFLAKSGAKAIILDNEFPQYTTDDATLAHAITDVDRGAVTGSSIPILFARTVNCRTQGNLVGQLLDSSNGLLDELEKLNPKNTSKIVEDFTGSVGVIEDEDQIVRRLATRMDSAQKTIESIPLKVLDRLSVLDKKAQDSIPDHIYIDFTGGANSEYYPIRPLTYLLNPQLRNQLAIPSSHAESGDVNVKDAIVIIGDGITDVFNTSTTNLGVDVMSGPEVLANSIDTLSRQSWLKRLHPMDCVLYIFALSFFGSMIILVKKVCDYRKLAINKKPLISWFTDLSTVVSLLAFTLLIPSFVFAYAQTILPIMSIFASFLLASILITLLERDHLREQSFQEQLKNEKEKFALIEKHHEQEMATEAANATVREIELDQNRRAEFVRRLRHDILGPASSINWTLLRLQKEEVTDRVKERFKVLMRNSETLINLVDELTRLYTAKVIEDNSLSVENDAAINLNQLLSECAKTHQSLAEERNGTINFIGMSEPAIVQLDATKLTRIASNLIRNAFLHNQTQTNVVIELQSDDNCLKLLIRDDGQGIASDRIEQIFADGVTTGKEDSSHEGLGLGIVKSLVNELGGVISVQSELNEGTTFQIAFSNVLNSSKPREKKSA